MICLYCDTDISYLLAQHETGERAWDAHSRDCPALWRMEVDVGEGVWHTNAMRYTFQHDAEVAAASLHSRWTLVRRTRVVLNSTPLREEVEQTNLSEG